MVVPVATAQQLTRGFRTTVAAALLLGVGYAISGVVFSYYADVASGASIVVLAIGGFMLATAVGALVRNRRRAAGPGLLAEAAEDDVAVQR
jgi:zinc transport system permease protein